MSKRGQWVSRTNLSKQVGTLRFSLLVALGLAPLSCGGTALRTSDGEGGSAGSIPQGGALTSGAGPIGTERGGDVGYAGGGAAGYAGTGAARVQAQAQAA